MANLFEVLQSGSRRNANTRQIVTTGVIVRFDAGLYRVACGQTTYRATSGVNQSLNKGDRVYLILGRGTAKIIGLLGADENV